MFNGLLVFSTLTTLLVTGLLFTFALLVMPGLGQLEDRAFLRGFQEIDRIIQNSHPVFVVVWLGSVVGLIAAVVMGVGQLDGLARGLLVAAAGLYVLGVQLPTMRGNVPLNNQLQSLHLETMSELELVEAREAFEPKWNRLNVFRTIICLVVALLLIVVGILR
ncbi:MAG: DUF1772 domain-containing protein [Verrucomicrobiales bacterium]|nr:DUF1772 domain-containing protein [Verrucomicrobiales bacterium]